MSARYFGGLVRKDPLVLNPAAGNAANGVFTMSQYMQAVKAATWPAYDPYFKQTVLSLHGNGTNGDQNNTFLDSSSNNFTITRNGNATQGTFSPFSVGAGEWSNYFDGNGDVLTVNGGTPLTFGTGNFTIEFWVYYNGGLTADVALYDSRPQSTNGVYPLIFSNPTGKLVYYVSSAARITGTTTLVTNTWYHVALARSGTDTKLFLNGVQEGSTYSDSNNYIVGTNRPSIGATGIALGADPLNGYMSNVRAIKGTALYTTTFTPPTAPLTAISNTQLLICQSNRFVDNSTNAFTITRNGDVRVTPFSPFAPSAAYSPSVNGGSGYFDGTGDYLAVGTASDWKFLHDGSNWTIEFWAYNTTNDFDAIVSTAAWSALVGLSVYFNLTANCVSVYFSRGVVASEAVFVSSASLKANQWNYVAITFENSGKTCSFYINGATAGSSSNAGFAYSSSNPTKTLAIGRGEGTTSPTPPGAEYTGYLGSLRISTNVRTGLTSVPTAPYTSDGDTKLLCNFTNAGIIDNTGKNNLETVGNAQIDTAVKKFGDGSLEFDGTGDYLVAPSNTELTLNADFTIEGWAYLNASGNYRFLTLGDSVGSTGIEIYVGSGNWLVYSNNATRITGAAATRQVWTYLAVVRSGSTVTLYINGTASGSTWSSSASFSGRLFVGAEFFNNGITADTNGYLDDLRITKGIARYTSNFTPQTSQWQDQ